MERNLTRVKPQLVRKRSHVITTKTNVTVIIRPSLKQSANLRDIAKSSKSVPVEIKATPTPPPAAAVNRQQLRTRRTAKKTTVKYISKDINPESLVRLTKLRNVGKHKILIIVGNGPSILEMELEKVKVANVDVLSINKPDGRLWPTKYWAFFDSSQFRRHEDLWNGYNGVIFNSTAIKRQKDTSIQFKNHGGKGWSRDLLRGIHIGRSSVFASMQIAAWMNYDHVYIVGCDMAPEGVNGKLHFYGQNPDVDPAVRRERFAKEAEFYDRAAELMAPEERARFTFCSGYNRHSFVDKFNRLDHRVAVERILEHAQKL